MPAKPSKSSPSILTYFSSQPAPKPKKSAAKKGEKYIPPAPEDIIVISDSDCDDIQITPKRKQDASSDVEVVEERLSVSPKKPRLGKGVEETPQVGNASTKSPTPRLVFGPASSILRSTSLSAKASTLTGPESLLQFEESEHIKGHPFKMDVRVPEGIEEDWLEGDEELELIDTTRDEIEVVGDEEDDVFDASFQRATKGSPCLSSSSCQRPVITGLCSSNAFSVLMSSNKETEAWKEADVAEDRSFRPTKSNRRKAPFYKVLQGMPIAVDAFRYGSIPGVMAYFLTHAHSDHYTNLSSSWDNGLIYCSVGTAKLIIHMLRVDKRWVKPLPNDVPCPIPNTGGVTVTLIEANHCPGSSLFLFEGPQTMDAGDSTYKSAYVGSNRQFRYLHCGDFRASPAHVLHPAVRDKKLDICYLDTTYLDPKYIFPPQPQVISACSELAKRLASGANKHDTNKGSITSWTLPSSAPSSTRSKRILFVVGTYSIGKERIVKAIAQALSSKVYCDARKTALLRCEDDPELHAMLTSDPLAADVHIVPLTTITSDKLKIYIERYKGHFTNAVGFRPTGWTYTPSPGSDAMPSISTVMTKCQNRTFTWANLKPTQKSIPGLEMYGVPYSEHSSFFELTCFCLSLDCVRLIATVNVGSEKSRGKMNKWFERWESERKKRKDAAGGKQEIVSHRADDYW